MIFAKYSPRWTYFSAAIFIPVLALYALMLGMGWMILFLFPLFICAALLHMGLHIRFAIVPNNPMLLGIIASHLAMILTILFISDQVQPGDASFVLDVVLYRLNNCNLVAYPYVWALGACHWLGYTCNWMSYLYVWAARGCYSLGHSQIWHYLGHGYWPLVLPLTGAILWIISLVVLFLRTNRARGASA